MKKTMKNIFPNEEIKKLSSLFNPETQTPPKYISYSSVMITSLSISNEPGSALIEPSSFT